MEVRGLLVTQWVLMLLNGPFDDSNGRLIVNLVFEWQKWSSLFLSVILFINVEGFVLLATMMDVNGLFYVDFALWTMHYECAYNLEKHVDLFGSMESKKPYWKVLLVVQFNFYLRSRVNLVGHALWTPKAFFCQTYSEAEHFCIYNIEIDELYYIRA